MNKIKTAVAMLVLGAMSLMVSQAKAAAKEDLEIAELSKQFYVLSSSGTSYGPAMNLYYTGSSSEAVVTITSATILAYAPFNVLDTGFLTGGAGDLSSTAFDTMGELCAAIDAEGSYGCELKGARYDDNTLRLRDQTAASGTNDLKGSGGFDVHFDTGPGNGGGGNQRQFNLQVGKKPAPGKRITVKQCVGQVSGTVPTLKVSGKLRLHEYDPVGGWVWNSANTVWQEDMVALSTVTRTFSINGIGGLEFAKDSQVAISAGNESTLQMNGNHLECQFEEK